MRQREELSLSLFIFVKKMDIDHVNLMCQLTKFV